MGETHSDLQAYSVAHRDIEGLGAVVMALQGHSQDSPRVANQRKCVSPSLQEHNLLLVRSIVLQSFYLQELLGHPDTGQLGKDAKVAGYPKAWGMRSGSFSCNRCTNSTRKGTSRKARKPDT